MKFYFEPTFILMPKAINFAKYLANDYTKQCMTFCEKRSPPEARLFETSAGPTVLKGTFRRPIRSIKKTANLVRMDVKR